MGKASGFLEFERETPVRRAVDERVRDWFEIYQDFPAEAVRRQGARCMDCGIPFCNHGCPLNNLIPDWNDLVYRDRWRDAIRALHATNNFPEFTGRVCPAPCEAACVLGINAQPVAIKAIERSIVDYAFEQGWIQPEPAPARTGKRVAVIGSGASAAQFVPCLDDEVAHLDVFQRTAPWLLPTDNYGDPFPPEFHDLLALLPQYGRWERLWQFWLLHEGLLGAARVDPEWDQETEAVSASNDVVRGMLLDVLRAQVPDDELYEKMVPHFPPFAKRALRDDGRWAASFARDHVELVTTPIAAVTATGVRTADGIEHPADVVIYGTGFTASDFITPMCVFGHGGLELNEEWGGDARAYLGMTVPDFPNFFMLYGPNTNLVINGSIIVMVECQVRYVVESLGRLLREGKRTMSCRRPVHEAYADEMQDGNARMVWGVADVPSWYRNQHGRVTQNWPFDLHSYWSRTLEPDLSDYELT